MPFDILLCEAAMKQIGRKLIKKAKKNLRKYVKKRGKELVKETAEATAVSINWGSLEN